MASTIDTPPSWARYVPWAAVTALFAGAGIVAVRFGAPAVVLWFAFAALAGASLLFWESLRAVIDANAPGDDDGREAGDDRLPSDLEAKKAAALRALKDIEFERSIGRISNEDYDGLREKYRAEARAAMEAMDEGLGAHLARAEVLIAEAVNGEAGQPKNKRKGKGTDDAADEPAAKSVSADGKRACASCETVNDGDAMFCKRCGARVASVESDA